MEKWKEITVCLDMSGCPNRCRHCWLGVTQNGNMPLSELEFMQKQFRPFTDCLRIYDWYREPDFKDDYQKRYDLCNRLSDKPVEHFELVSFWRLARDKEYAKWLSGIGLKKAQLTIFGGEETTDLYVGRKGAYAEILNAVEILIENRISPRIQTFVNQNNIAELPYIENLINRLELESRCQAFGGAFSFFLHQGSCDGENEKCYDIRVTPEDLVNIPEKLAAYTLRHFGKNDLAEVFGETEQSLYERLIGDHTTADYVEDSPVFYIDKDFNVYPNITAPAAYWCLGNLKRDGAETILEHYVKSNSVAQKIRLTVPLCDIVKAQGDRESRRLFSEGDYTVFLLNQYCRGLTECDKLFSECDICN